MAERVKVKQTERALKRIGEEMKRGLPAGIGFAVLVFPLRDGGNWMNYVSNANRDDMVKALREAADRLDGKKPDPNHITSRV